MAGVAPAYVGKRPPDWRRKRREWEQRQVREREQEQAEERERELSPAVPDPEPVTPSRGEIFASPGKSARVYKTYAHKRARSQASSVADESDDAQDGASPEPSPESSPTRAPNRAAYRDPKPMSTRMRRSQSRSAFAAAATPSGSPNIRPHPSSSTVYVEIAQRRKQPPAQSKATGSAPRAGPHARGRSRDTKAIPLPTPSSISEDDDESRPRKRARVPSRPTLSLSEALNRSFAGASSPQVGAAPASFASTSLHAAGPSLSRRSGRMRSFSRARPRIAEEGDKSAGEDVAPVIPAKRPRGRPRKDTTSRPPSRTPSRPRRSVSRRRSSQHVQLMQDFDTPSQINLQQSVDVSPLARALEEQAMREAQSPCSALKKPRGRPKGSKNRSTLEREALARAPETHVRDSPSQMNLRQSVDVRTLARALEEQAMREAERSPPPRPRGRPKGSKNKSTLEREASARAAAERSLPANPIVPTPGTVKRGPGRPRKSAPNMPTVPLGDTIDYMEPLKDPDEEDVPHPSTLHPGRRGRSRTRRNSTPAASTPAYYLDMTTLQWKPRARSVSASPPKRRVKAIEEIDEYQGSSQLCAALKQRLLQAPPTKVKGAQSQGGVDDGLRVAPSGLLLLGDQGDAGDGPTVSFRGCWEIVAARDALCDDALAMKTLLDIVKQLGIYINYRQDSPAFAKSDDGRTVAVAAPCGCMALREQASASGSTDVSSSLTGCTGEMTVSITEKEAESFPGEKAHRVIVSVIH